jgi:hypothetical protein
MDAIGMNSERRYLMFSLKLQLEHEQPLTSADPTVIDDKLINETFNLIGLFVEGAADELGLEMDETRLRELVVECCYRLIFREMTTLRELPKGRFNVKPKSRRARRKEREQEQKEGNQ